MEKTINWILKLIRPEIEGNISKEIEAKHARLYNKIIKLYNAAASATAAYVN